MQAGTVSYSLVTTNERAGAGQIFGGRRAAQCVGGQQPTCRYDWNVAQIPKLQRFNPTDGEAVS